MQWPRRKRVRFRHGSPKAQKSKVEEVMCELLSFTAATRDAKYRDAHMMLLDGFSIDTGTLNLMQSRNTQAAAAAVRFPARTLSASRLEMPGSPLGQSCDRIGPQLVPIGPCLAVLQLEQGGARCTASTAPEEIHPRIRLRTSLFVISNSSPNLMSRHKAAYPRRRTAVANRPEPLKISMTNFFRLQRAARRAL